MEMFMHSVANCVNDNKQFSLVYKMLKDVDMYSMVLFDNVLLRKAVGMSKPTYYGFMKRLIGTELVKRVSTTGVRGKIKYMVNPYIIYNHKKTRANDMYAENCDMWNSL